MISNSLLETKDHLKLKLTIHDILKRSNFSKIDLEVDVDSSSKGHLDLSVDVCAIEHDTMFVFQCKDRKSISDPQKEFSSITNYINAVKNKTAIVKKSKNGIISTADLNKIKHVIVCYAFTKKLSNVDAEELLNKYGFNYWNYKVVKYYDRISIILEKLTKNQILKEFGIPFNEKISTWKEFAIEVKQDNKPSMYLLGIHPGLLLKIGYVYRRGANKSDAYQRILNKDRLDKISEFLKSDELMLSNPVIIVFDDDDRIQEEFCYDDKTKKLRFPTAKSCAWIIDGQHRIFGFKDHPKYSTWSDDQTENDLFKIPVVAYQKLSEKDQSKTFVNINYYQKRIDTSLFSDLATVIQDLKYPITWPCLLVSEMNKSGPCKDLVKISELDENKPISISAFANLKLLDTLLGYKKTKIPSKYSGILYETAEFDVTKPFDDPLNNKAFNTHLAILNRFFKAVKSIAENKDPNLDLWHNYHKFGLTKREGINALLLVLNAFLVYDKNMKNLEKYLSAIDAVDFRNDKLLKYGRGYPAFSKIANKIIRKMNSKYKTKLKVIRKKRKN